MDLLERFLKYVQINTMSDDHVNVHPSTVGQLNFAYLLKEELEQLGAEDVSIDANGLLFGCIPSNSKNTQKLPTIGLVGHLDTFPGFSGNHVKPICHYNYDGKPIYLENNLCIAPDTFEELNQYIGDDLITADGNTLLGANGKAGVAEIITAVEYFINHSEIEHGEIKILITPDQETVISGIECLTKDQFEVDFALTVDGDGLGEVSFENFNAASAKVVFKGRQVFTGQAKGKLVNALRIAAEWVNLLPDDETPEKTSDYEGFIHFEQLEGSVEHTEITCMIRDFEIEGLMKRKHLLQEITKKINDKYDHIVAEITITDEYSNMRSAIEYKPMLVKTVVDGITRAGVLPKVVPIRGCSDGAYLAKLGIPAPNIFTGGHNCHGPYEFVSVQSMEKAVQSIIEIIKVCQTIEL